MGNKVGCYGYLSRFPQSMGGSGLHRTSAPGIPNHKRYSYLVIVILLISILCLSNILILNLRPLYSLQVLARPSICYQIISALITFHIDLTYHTRSSHWIQPVIFALLNGGLIHFHLIILHTLHARYSTLIIHLSLTITDSALMSRCQE